MSGAGWSRGLVVAARCGGPGLDGVATLRWLPSHQGMDGTNSRSGPLVGEFAVEALGGAILPKLCPPKLLPAQDLPQLGQTPAGNSTPTAQAFMPRASSD